MREERPRGRGPRRVGRFEVLAAGLALAALVSMGAGPSKGLLSKRRAEAPLKAEETVGDLAFVRAADSIEVEGVGLVIGLDHTGSNPEPSRYRQELLSLMRKARVPDPERWLEDDTTSLVLVRATIPVGITTKDVFDIKVELTPNSQTQSLAGGRLLMTELKQIERIQGEELPGHVLARAFGPVMTGSAEDPEDPKAGRVLGGARVKKDIPYTLILKDGRQGFRTISMVQSAVNRRFHQRKGVDQTGMAKAETDEFLVLNVPRVYHHNQLRYFQVIERLPVLDNPALRGRRMEQWSRELLDPKTAGQSALRLEGVGRNAIEALKAGLESPDPRVRFFAAESLAYLDEDSGVGVLGDAVVQQSAFRAQALAALAALDQPSSTLRLRALMSQADPAIRYGAFNALRTLDELDPFLGRVRVLEVEQPDPGPDDPLALRMPTASRRSRPRPDDPFELYVVDCEGPPMVHVSRSRRCEIVVFGRGQELLTPIVLGGGGPILLNASLNDRAVQISRIGTGRPGDPDLRVSSPLTLGSVIREAANLGAGYPEVLAILRSAELQKNLPGPLVLDAVPAPSTGYDAAQLAGADPSDTKRDDAVGQASLESESEQPADEDGKPRRRGLLFNRLFRGIGNDRDGNRVEVPADGASSDGLPALPVERGR